MKSSALTKEENGSAAKETKGTDNTPGTNQDQPKIVYRDSGIYSMDDLFQIGVFSILHTVDQARVAYFEKCKQDFNLHEAISHFTDALVNKCELMKNPPDGRPRASEFEGLELMGNLYNVLVIYNTLSQIPSLPSEAKQYLTLRQNTFTAMILPDVLDTLLKSLDNYRTKIDLVKAVLLQVAGKNATQENDATVKLIEEKMIFLAPQVEQQSSAKFKC